MIDLSDIKQKAEDAAVSNVSFISIIGGIKSPQNGIDGVYHATSYYKSVPPSLVLKLLRIIEVQGEALKDMQRYECANKELLAEHILILAKQAEEQVSKILTEQNEVTK